jgi:DNA-binding response OmpR family regulator
MVAGETESGSRERRDAMESRGVGTSLERQLRVIVLDASPTTRKILEVILRREGHQVVCFDDPLEALRFLSRHGPADLLFLGIDLPKVDGFNVLKYLKGEARFHSMVSIALLSEQDGILSRVKARLAGAQQVMLKPLVRQRIVTLVSGYRLSISDPEADR